MRENYRWAESLLAQGDPLGALQVLAPLLSTDATFSVRLLAARAYYHSAQLGRAETLLTELIESDPTDHYTRFLLGRTLERAGRRPESVRHFRLAAALSASPDYVEALARVC
ncbi:tetratricopeptide repeat protein [Crossiella cryophila]|uniref:Flp pilus assembly protein TadD n=1 Tax=Crossiella cryophila TaxID=43355 RepID=A0A7W7C9V8_9PSEU|nr:tetratricopeptide repeat protein [Crossiella cryophila]MBB4676006.1 Flp pilus assembly protein TadD [Crossiella cryophila]